jgi:hypothetical protein
MSILPNLYATVMMALADSCDGHADQPWGYFLTCGMRMILIEYGAQRHNYAAASRGSPFRSNRWANRHRESHTGDAGTMEETLCL